MDELCTATLCSLHVYYSLYMVWNLISGKAKKMFSETLNYCLTCFFSRAVSVRWSVTTLGLQDPNGWIIDPAVARCSE